MDLWTIRAVAALVLLSAVVLAWWHLRERRRHRRTELPPEQYDYYRRQFRRRIQVCMMLGLLAVLMAIESWVNHPLGATAVGIGMLLLLFWIMLLALVDALATRMHFNRLKNDYMVEQAKLEAEARRLRGAGGNGKPRGGLTEPEQEDAH